LNLPALLLRYIEVHNQGVRSGDFSQLLDLFAPDSVMRFPGIEFGPLQGIEAIREAFRTHPPDDELYLLSETSNIEGGFAYSWRRASGTRAGILRLIERDGRIMELIASRDRVPQPRRQV
jgi:SnoaL-like domain